MTRPPSNRPPRGSRSSRGMSQRDDPRYSSDRGPAQRRSYSGGSPSSRPGLPSGSKEGNPGIRMNTGTVAVLAGVLVVGVGIGSAITSTTNPNSYN